MVPFKLLDNSAFGPVVRSAFESTFVMSEMAFFPGPANGRCSRLAINICAGLDYLFFFPNPHVILDFACDMHFVLELRLYIFYLSRLHQFIRSRWTMDGRWFQVLLWTQITCPYQGQVMSTLEWKWYMQSPHIKIKSSLSLIGRYLT